MLQEIFHYLITNDIALEINTSARRRKGLDQFPSNEKLQLYKSIGGSKITIGSDAHRLNEIYDSIETIDLENKFNKGVYIKRKFTLI